MSAAKAVVIDDWKIVLEPANDPDWNGQGTLDIIHGEEEDAIEHLEAWAEILESRGQIPPRSMDWQNESFISVGKRLGRKTFQVRCDTFERETDNGMTSGAGRLTVRRCYTEASK